MRQESVKKRSMRGSTIRGEVSSELEMKALAFGGMMAQKRDVELQEIAGHVNNYLRDCKTSEEIAMYIGSMPSNMVALVEANYDDLRAGEYISSGILMAIAPHCDGSFHVPKKYQ